MAAPTQKGTALKVGFGSFAYTGYLPEDGLSWAKPLLNETIVKDEDNLTITKILSDPANVFNMTLIIKNVGGSITPPAKGDPITITDPGGATLVCMTVDANVAFARDQSRLKLSLIKEDSMSYSS